MNSTQEHHHPSPQLPPSQPEFNGQGAGAEADLTIPTLKRAKTRLGVKSNKLPDQWTWELPPE